MISVKRSRLEMSGRWLQFLNSTVLHCSLDWQTCNILSSDSWYWRTCESSDVLSLWSYLPRGQDRKWRHRGTSTCTWPRHRVTRSVWSASGHAHCPASRSHDNRCHVTGARRSWANQRSQHRPTSHRTRPPAVRLGLQYRPKSVQSEFLITQHCI